MSHLSLNHLSIAEGDGAADALREILRLYDFRESAETRRASAGKHELRAVATDAGGRTIAATRHVRVCR